MNDVNDFSPQANEDGELEVMLSPLKALEPPLETRVANRRMVAEALSSSNRWAQPTLQEPGIRPWWRRSVSVPVPLAIGLTVLMALAVISIFQNWRQRPAKAPAGSDGVAATASTDGERGPTVKPATNTRPIAKFYESETYLCGIGRISSESSYVFKD